MDAQSPCSSRTGLPHGPTHIVHAPRVAAAPNGACSRCSRARDGAPVSRDRLLGILWPDRDERSARHLLADSLYVLRQTLGDEAIVASGESLQLSPDLVWTDVVEFRRALAEERWSDALDLYRGDFLDGFFVRNAADFDQWAMAERSRLQRLATRAASALADVLERAGRLPEAANAAERALELSPCDETLFRNLVRLLIAADNSARAVAVALGFHRASRARPWRCTVGRDDAARSRSPRAAGFRLECKHSARPSDARHGTFFGWTLVCSGC